MRKVFFSFHYKNDNWRVQQIINMGIVDHQKIFLHNEWEKVKKQGDFAIKKWIDENMHGCSCIVVLIGSGTSERKWVNYEIEKAWNDGRALLGIYINNIKDSFGKTDKKGKNPFDNFTVKGKKLSDFVTIFEPKPDDAYNNIKKMLPGLIETAICTKKN